MNSKRAARAVLVALSAVVAVGVLAPATVARETNEQLAQQVRETETAFAKTMADRDHPAFVSFIADDAVFFGSKSVFRGKAAVAAGWKPLFEAPAAPFSWAPDRVEVLESGKLALSTGPILTAEGKEAGTFTSIWRREGKGRWKIVFDKGCPPCESPRKEADMQEIHRQMSVKCFNECWGLIEKSDRTAEDTENMLLLAEASLWHWRQRTDCQPSNLSVGYWQVSRVHALAGNTDAAKTHLANARAELKGVTEEDELEALEPDIAALERLIAAE